jgi:small-conductance mechanosensitive channel
MKLIYQAWQNNNLENWLIALAIAIAVIIAIIAVKYGAARAFRMLARNTEARFGTIPAEVAAATRLWLLLPFALYGAASGLELPAKLHRFIDILAVIALMVQVALWVNRFISLWFRMKVDEKRDVDGASVTALMLIGVVARTLVWALTGLLILDHLGFDITALIAGLGIGGIAVALAAQNILGDLFASLSIVLDKPFVVGDFVVAEGWRGTIERVGIKTTRVRSLDGEQIILSNAELLKMRLHNYKRMQERRILFGVGVTYQTPADKLERVPQLIRDAIERQQLTRFDRAHFKDYGDSSLNYEVVYYVLAPEYGVYMDTQQAINLEIFRAFAQEGIEFAYPTRTLYVTNVPAAAG